MLTVSQIKELFKQKLINKEFVTDKTGVKMIEILNANFIADKDILFGTHNYNWYARELEWYLSKSLNVNDIPPPIPKIWQQVADKNGFINSNYGWAIFSSENFKQYDNCRDTLLHHPDSRRAVMIYNRPEMHQDYKFNGMSDFMCHQFSQHFIRDNVLTLHSNWRSQDMIFGYKGDYQWMNWVHNKLYNELKQTNSNLQIGPMYWNVMSAHIYQSHFDLVE